jgi:tyrosyl-tRNA synthetase
VRAGLAASNGEARRLLKGGGGKVNDAAVGETDTIGNGHLKDGAIKLTAGKKRHVLVKAG